MRWIFIFSFGMRLFAGSFDEVMPSSPEEILSLTSDLLVDGYVSAFSGQIALCETDLRVKGAQDLVLKRTYVPPQIFGRYDDKDRVDRLMLGKALLQLETKGWVIHPHLWTGYNHHSPYFQVRDPQGFVLEFQIQGNKGVLKTPSYGCSNLRGGEPSAEADIRNIELWIEADCVKVSWPDGTQRHYLKLYPSLYQLDKEVLPNGKLIRYEYNEQGLFKISSCDPNGKFVYAFITRFEDNHFLGSDGREAHLVYERRDIKGKYKERGHKERATFHFSVMTRGINPIYANTVAYNERTLLHSYDAKDYPISCTYFQTKNAPARIQTFSNPSGSFSFSYDPPIAGQKGGSTTVTHPDQAQTIYRFNQLLLLEAVENWLEGELVNKKAFAYDHKQHIKSIEVLDGEGKLLLARRFECNTAGNPILEKWEGDFGVFCIKRTFDKNRLVFEERDDGLQYAFTYLGNTRLITSKTTLELGKKIRKTFYFYDAANNLIREEEEGKTKTVYTLYQTNPHLHQVEWEEKSDRDGNLIHKIQYRYDDWGNINQEHHYDSDGNLAYSIYRTYNEKGELLAETNPVGEMAIYKYDPRGRCFYEEPFSNGLVIGRTFDAKGRLKVLSEGDYETRFDYNSSDELIEKTDYLSYTTKYHYHPVHGKPDRIEEPAAITEIVYDSFGREKEKIDPYQAKTIKTYNSYSAISTITYPEGGEEIFGYYPNGLLKSHTDPDGLITSYTYDVLGRVKEKTVGQATTFFEYDSYHLSQTTDPAGFVTRYQYDLAGRKIEEKRQNRTSRYGYDPLGFLAWQERSGRRIKYTNDSLGRLCQKVDGPLVTSWAYDGGSNIATVEQGGITSFYYDPHNRLIEKIDPEGHKTQIRYEKGPYVLLKKTTDPLGIETVETYSPQGLLLEKEIDGQTVEEFEYDQLFRLKRQDHLTFGYTRNGQRQWVKEAESRTTHWTYTPGDRLLTKQKPDGTVWPYEYDPQWRLKKIGTREFQYDSLNRIIGGTGFSRKLDAFGNIKREEWSNGLWIESDYDDWDRPLLRRLPDHTRIEYQYQGPFLKKVSRLSQDGQELYSQTYDQYDANGHPRLIMGLFHTAYEYDRLGREVSQQTPFGEEIVYYDPLGNLIKKGDTTYTYDSLSQMTSESDRFAAKYDTRYNLQEFNGQSIEVDSLNQIKSLHYDPNGNLLKAGFVYDEFDQLVEAGGETFTYDALGRRIQKGAVSFLYIDQEEIGAFEQKEAKELKVPGLKDPIAIELNRVPYAPVVDVQGVVRLLVDWKTATPLKQNNCDAFAQGLSGDIPYAYVGKRYDASTNLIYFGKRYYDPSIRRWLTPDPMGAIDHSNLYQYVFNNPYRFQDPTGEFIFGIPILVWGAELAIPTLSACISTIIYGAATGAVVYGGYKLVEAFNQSGSFSMGDYYAGDLTPGLNDWSYRTMKSGSGTTLPKNPDDLSKRPGWKETSHPDAKKGGHRTFENKETGEKVRHDEARPGASGHRGESHWHRFNPDSKNRFDEYLDANNVPVPRNSPESHLYPEK